MASPMRGELLRSRLMLLALAVLAMLVPAPRTMAQADPAPLGLACTATEGVRWCPGNGTSDRIPSWDGTPLDADVTLPPDGDGPWPLIVLLHGLGGDKSQLQPNAPQQSGLAPRVLPNTTHYSNLWYASRGYATLSYTTRGFGESCGGNGFPGANLQPPPCDTGFIRVADARYEARDTQHLVGLLVDEGIAVPDRIGATGFSYGGGISLLLGALNDHIRCPGFSTGPDDPCTGKADGEYVPWRSPAGTSVKMGAAYPQWLWSDLIASLLPNGRFLDFDDTTNDSSTNPLGVMSQSYIHALAGLAGTEGYLLTPAQAAVFGAEEWDLVSAVALLDAGEPYGSAVQQIADAFYEYHGGFTVPSEPAPMLLESGWSDDLFTPAESIRQYNQTRADFPNAFVAMALGDLGHGRNGNKNTVSLGFNDLASAFFDEHLRDVGTGPEAGSVTVYTTTCPAGLGGAPDGGPFVFESWEAAHPTSLTFGDPAAQTITHPGGDPTVDANYDPIPQINPLGAFDPCKTVAASDAPGTAVYETPSEGFTMLGRPTIRATIETTGANGQLVGRLWDVHEGQQLLVNRGVYRLLDDQSGEVVFQLAGNAWEFEDGHTIKLELTASDAPYLRASNGAFQVDVTGLSIELPIMPADAQPIELPGPTPFEEPKPVTPVTGPAVGAFAGLALLLSGLAARRRR